MLGKLVLILLLVWLGSRASQEAPGEEPGRRRKAKSRGSSRVAPISMRNLRRSFVRRYGR